MKALFVSKTFLILCKSVDKLMNYASATKTKRVEWTVDTVNVCKQNVNYTSLISTEFCTDLSDHSQSSISGSYTFYTDSQTANKSRSLEEQTTRKQNIQDSEVCPY